MSQPVVSLEDSVLRALSKTFDSLREQGVLTPVITLDALKASLNPEQRVIVDQILNLNPKDYGVATPYAGALEPVPNNLVKVGGQKYTQNGQQRILDDCYIPRHIFDAYTRMNERFMNEHPSRQLLIGACYRSPAYQVMVFIYWLLHKYKGNIAKAISHVSPPAYSQHTIASKAAIDFKTIDGSPSDHYPEDFEETLEYAWLRQHAKDFGFHESWTRGNEFGMRAEPWHWQYLDGFED